MSFTIGSLNISATNGLIIGNATLASDNIPTAQIIELPNISDTLVSKSSIDILSNKTLQNPILMNSGVTLSLPTSQDTLVGRNTTDSLSNKTLQNPILMNSGVTLSLPTSQDTLVGRNTTDSLSNKTLTGTTNIIQASHIGQGLNAVQISGTPQLGYVLTATGSTGASWQPDIEPVNVQATKTTTGTAVTIISIPVQINSCYLVSAMLTAKCLTTGSVNFYSAKLESSFYCLATISTLSQIQSDVLTTFTKTKSNFSVSSSADTTNGNINIVVNGGTTSAPVNWFINVEYINN